MVFHLLSQMHGENTGTPIRAIRACKEMAIKRQRNARRRNGIRKSGRRPRNGSAARPTVAPTGSRVPKLWGNCATAWFRYIRPPRSEPLRPGFLISAIACQHPPDLPTPVGVQADGWTGQAQARAGPRRGRGPATKAGNAVMDIFHPLVKVIIFPTSFSAMPVPADWPDNVRHNPGRVALGAGIKVHQE